MDPAFNQLMASARKRGADSLLASPAQGSINKRVKEDYDSGLELSFNGHSPLLPPLNQSSLNSIPSSLASLPSYHHHHNHHHRPHQNITSNEAWQTPIRSSNDHMSSHMSSHMPILSLNNELPPPMMSQPAHIPTPAPAQQRAPSKPKPKEPGYNRKDKSLGLLCENFVYQYQDKINVTITLDEAAKTMGVERRRIYDIVNILEAVSVVERRGKNSYVWHGLTRVAERLSALKDVLEQSEKETGGALAVGIHEMNQSVLGSEYQVPIEVMDLIKARTLAIETGQLAPEDPVTNLLHHNSALSSHIHAESGHTSSNSFNQYGQIQNQPQLIQTPYVPVARTASKRRAEGDISRKEQSLSYLTQIFLQMFLLNETRIVSLEDAAKWLLRGQTGEASTTSEVSSSAHIGVNSNLMHNNDPHQMHIHHPQEQQHHDNSVSNNFLPSLHDNNDQPGGGFDLSSHHMPSQDHSMLPMHQMQMNPPHMNSSPPANHTTEPAPATKTGKTTNRSASLFKSKVRRLYDIANVLMSLRLVEKIHLINTRKAAFKWKGGDPGMEVYNLNSTVHGERYTSEPMNRREMAMKRKNMMDSGVMPKLSHGISSSVKREIKSEHDQQMFHQDHTAPKALSFSFNDSSNRHSHLPPPPPAPQPMIETAIPVMLDNANENRYFFSNHPHSFSIMADQMSAFKPLDFAYLPFLAPTDDSVRQAAETASSIAVAKGAAVNPTVKGEDGAHTDELPRHLLGTPQNMQASYIKEHGEFINLFSDVCSAWINKIPEMNAKAMRELKPVH